MKKKKSPTCSGLVPANMEMKTFCPSNEYLTLKKLRLYEDGGIFDEAGNYYGKGRYEGGKLIIVIDSKA